MKLEDFVFTKAAYNNCDTVNSYYCKCNGGYIVKIWALASKNNQDNGRPITEFELGTFNFQVENSETIGTKKGHRVDFLKAIGMEENMNRINEGTLCRILQASGGEVIHKNYCANCEASLMTDDELCWACEKGI